MPYEPEAIKKLIEDYEKLQAENDLIKKAWEHLREILEKYNYNVGGEPNVVRAGILQFEQVLKGK